jgi:diguanylate cyclase (GGDEF)-like protein
MDGAGHKLKELDPPHSLMKKQSIDFRQLLERVLPIEELPATDRLRVQRALRSGVASQLESAALAALTQLEQLGALRRLPATNGTPVMRYQARGKVDVITVPLQVPASRDGLYRHSRVGLSAEAGLDELRRLLRIDDPTLLTPASGGGRELIERLDDVGRELLGAIEVRFHPAGEDSGPGRGVLSDGSGPLDESLAREARVDARSVLYCPDVERCPRLKEAAARRGARAVAVAAAVTETRSVVGHIEVLCEETEPFRPADLAMVALLADACGLAWERSSRLERLMFVDPLTSAYNRSYFDVQLQNEMARARRENSSLALCIVDIDNFKSVNTTYGYEAGNQTLIAVAETLRTAVRPFDAVCRWGGEEFAVLLTAPVNAEDVATVSERLRSLVERQDVEVEALDRRKHHIRVTVSIGVALFPDDERSAEELWRAANRALLTAKQPPKNRVVFYRDPQPETGP